MLLQTMARALEWTPNVASIVYSPHPHLIPVEAKVVRDLVPRGGLANGLPHLTQIPQNRSEHPFRGLIGALYLSQYSGVRELRIEASRDDESGTPFTFAFFDFPDAIDFQAGRYLFQNLERCELNIKIWSRHDDGGKQRVANLSRMLAAAHDLRHLTLHITSSQLSLMGLQPDQSMCAPLGLMKTWHKLRSLSLGGIYADGKEFLDLIRRHRYTITNLSFRKCSLFSGAWADVVDEVVYSTGILPFVLDSVNETMIPTGNGTAQSSAELEEWRYEGHVEVSTDGERNFVRTNSTPCNSDYR